MNSVSLIKIVLTPLCQIPGVFPVIINPLLRKMNLGKYGVVDAKILGNQFEINLNDYTQRRAWLGVFEKREIRFIKQFLRTEDIAIDAGANIGLLTVPMARAVAGTGRVLAFEPVPQNVEHLRRNLYLNNVQNVSVFQTALGDSNDVIFLTDSHSSADKSTGFFHLTKEENQGIAVNQVTLESALNNQIEQQVQIRLLKIDVEGMEEKVLAGLGEWLQPPRIQAIMFETFIGPEGFATPSKNVLALLENHGYEICHMQSPRKLSRLMNIYDETRRRRTTLNLIAVAPSTK